MCVVEVAQNNCHCNKEIVKLQGDSLHYCDDQREEHFIVAATEHHCQVGSHEDSRASTFWETIEKYKHKIFLTYRFISNPLWIKNPRTCEAFAN